jgi:folate-binding protein YgfZ
MRDFFLSLGARFEPSDGAPAWWQPTMPLAFGELAAELAAARSGKAIADGSLFAALAMSGPDRHEFLNRLLTNAVPTRAGESCQAYYLSVSGRPLVQFFVLEQADRTLLICPATQREAAFAELDKMHFGEKLRLQPLPISPVVVFGKASFPYFGCPHELVLESDEAFWRERLADGAVPIGALALEVLRIEAGTPTPADYGEKTLFLEIANRDCYSEIKGCYPGQEVVARTLHRGHINRHLEPLKAASTAAHGTKLLLAEKEVGWISSSALGPEGAVLLGYLRREVWKPGTELVLASSRETAVVVETK